MRTPSTSTNEPCGTWSCSAWRAFFAVHAAVVASAAAARPASARGLLLKASRFNVRENLFKGFSQQVVGHVSNAEWPETAATVGLPNSNGEAAKTSAPA